MRIAFLGTSNPEANASQVRLYHLARAMAGAGNEVAVIVPDNPINRNFPALHGTPVAFHGFKARAALSETFSKCQQVWSGYFDVVHVVGIGLRSLQLVGRPITRPFYVQDYDELMISQESHSPGKRAYYWLMEGITRQRAHAIVVASRNLECFIRER